MLCDDCHVREAMVIYNTSTIDFNLCITCARQRIEAMRKRMAHLTKQVRQIEQTIPETWLEFMKTRQTS